MLTAARSLSRRQRTQHHDGPTISRAALDVLAALVWHHNSDTGFCYPSYERLSQAAGCSRSTVALCLRALEWSGLLHWAHRIDRVREAGTDYSATGHGGGALFVAAPATCSDTTSF